MPSLLASLLRPPSAFARAWRALYEGIYYVLESGTRLVFRTLFRVRRVGPPPRLPAGGVLLCPNHQSYLDPALVQVVLRRRLTFVMTNEFYRSRAANWFFRLVGALPIGRGRVAHASVRRAVGLLRTGSAVVVFPEGRLSTDGSLHPAQRGIARLAREGRAPIIPVAIEGSMRAWPRGARWLRRADVRIGFGDPIPWVGSPDRGADQAFADGVLEAIKAVQARLPGPRA